MLLLSCNISGKEIFFFFFLDIIIYFYDKKEKRGAKGKEKKNSDSSEHVSVCWLVVFPSLTVRQIRGRRISPCSTTIITAEGSEERGRESQVIL